MLTEAVDRTDALDVESIRRDLFTYTVGRRICLYDAVSSTNDVLRRMAEAGAAEGTVVIAETQTAGRARAGKAWFSPPGVNLYASILFRPAVRPSEAGTFSFIGSLALADAMRELGLPVAIKWPNDVLVKRKKVAGTLLELAASGDRLEYAILGLGVNVNAGRDTLAAGLAAAAQGATSLREALGRSIDRNAFAASVLGFLDEWLARYRAEGAGPILRAWASLDIVTGRRVEVRGPTMTVEGRARGVHTDGLLRVEDAHGCIHRIATGDVRLME